jgi:hypothetical protein
MLWNSLVCQNCLGFKSLSLKVCNSIQGWCWFFRALKVDGLHYRLWIGTWLGLDFLTLLFQIKSKWNQCDQKRRSLTSLLPLSWHYLTELPIQLQLRIVGNNKTGSHLHSSIWTVSTIFMLTSWSNMQLTPKSHKLHSIEKHQA